MHGQGLGIFKSGESRLLHRLDLFRRRPPAGLRHELDWIRVLRADTLKERMVPCAKGLCEIVKKPVGTATGQGR